jgi:hypothetical protein
MGGGQAVGCHISTVSGARFLFRSLGTFDFCSDYLKMTNGMPNKADAQNPAMTSLFQSGHHERGVCDLRRSAAQRDL